MPFNLDLSKQALEVTFARTTRSYHSQTCFNVIFECLPAYFSKKCSNQCKVQKGVFVLLCIRLENQQNTQ